MTCWKNASTKKSPPTDALVGSCVRRVALGRAPQLRGAEFRAALRPLGDLGRVPGDARLGALELGRTLRHLGVRALDRSAFTRAAIRALTSATFTAFVAFAIVVAPSPVWGASDPRPIPRATATPAPGVRSGGRGDRGLPSWMLLCGRPGSVDCGSTPKDFALGVPPQGHGPGGCCTRGFKCISTRGRGKALESLRRGGGGEV
jgi:hypothetical protein